MLASALAIDLRGSLGPLGWPQYQIPAATKGKKTLPDVLQDSKILGAYNHEEGTETIMGTSILRRISATNDTKYLGSIRGFNRCTPLSASLLALFPIPPV